MTEIERLVGRVCAGVYIALTGALSEDAAALAHQVMFDLAESPDLRPDERKIYYLIARNATVSLDELETEVKAARRGLHVVQGGNAA